MVLKRNSKTPGTKTVDIRVPFYSIEVSYLDLELVTRLSGRWRSRGPGRCPDENHDNEIGDNSQQHDDGVLQGPHHVVLNRYQDPTTCSTRMYESGDMWGGTIPGGTHRIPTELSTNPPITNSIRPLLVFSTLAKCRSRVACTAAAWSSGISVMILPSRSECDFRRTMSSA